MSLVDAVSLLVIDPDRCFAAKLLSSIAADAPANSSVPLLLMLLLLLLINALLLLLLMLLILNYDKSIDAADQFFAPSIHLFFAVSPTSNAAKRIGVPPLLQESSRPHCLWAAIVKLLWDRSF